MLQQLKSAGPYTTCNPAVSYNCVDGPLRVDALLGVDEATVDAIIPTEEGGTCVASESVECNGDGSAKWLIAAGRLAIYSCSGSWAGPGKGDDPSDAGSPPVAFGADHYGSGDGKRQSPRCDAPPISGGAPTTIPDAVSWLSASGHRIAVADPATGVYAAASKQALVQNGFTWTDSGPGQNVFRGSACDDAGTACKVRLESGITQVRGAVTANAGGNTQLGLVASANVWDVGWTSGSLKFTKAHDPNTWTLVDSSAYSGYGDIAMYGVALKGGNPDAAAKWADMFVNGWDVHFLIQRAIDTWGTPSSVARRTLTAASVFDPAQNLDSNMPEHLNTPLRTRQTLYDWARGHAYKGPLWHTRNVTAGGVTSFPRCLTATPDENCSGQKTWDVANTWWQQIQEGGLDGNGTNGSAPSMSIPVWMAMANPRPNLALPASQAFADPNSYKIKSQVNVSYLVDHATNKIIEGTVSSSYDVRVGNAHLPFFVTDFIKAVEADYGIAKPDIDYLTKDALVHGQDQVARPYANGDTPGQAYFPHFRKARLNADRTCVDFRAVGGGVHGYRPMISHQYINDNVKAWVDQIKAHNGTNFAVRALAGDIYSMFFKNDGSNNAYGSMIGNAPPIWQDIAAEFCALGWRTPTHAADNKDMNPAKAMVYQSHMPDLYVYIDEYRSPNGGGPWFPMSPVKAGDWRKFSNLPVISSTDPWTWCNTATRGSGGNPWGIEAPVPYLGDGPGQRPTSVRHCDAPGTVFDTTVTP
ncbi:hypothetical protein ACQ86F_34665 [Streptomyces venezuelae ATCC 10712]